MQGKINVNFLNDYENHLQRFWKEGIVVKLMRKKIGLWTLKNRLTKVWESLHIVQMIEIENNYFAIKFRTVDDVIFALTGGPWRVLGHYLHVQSWHPSFHPLKNKISTMVVWVRFSNLPLHLYNRLVLRVLGGILGKVISIDFETDSCVCGKYALIAMELDLNKPIVTSFLIKGKEQPVMYENISLI